MANFLKVGEKFEICTFISQNYEKKQFSDENITQWIFQNETKSYMCMYTGKHAMSEDSIDVV